MPGSIFIIQNDDPLVEMTHQPYTTEDHLQRFLERYPSLPAGGPGEMQPGHGAGCS